MRRFPKEIRRKKSLNINKRINNIIALTLKELFIWILSRFDVQIIGA